MTLLVCGLIWFNPITHESRRVCVPVEMVVRQRHLEGDRRDGRA